MLTTVTVKVRHKTLAVALNRQSIPDYEKLSDNLSNDKFLSDWDMEGRLNDPLLFWGVVHAASYLS
jgi:hypothetical protein